MPYVTETSKKVSSQTPAHTHVQGLSETAVMDVMSSSLQQQRIIVEQLRREAAVERQPVSESCAAMMRYISQHEQEDYLLTGFSSQKVNPFREKSSCSVL